MTDCPNRFTLLRWRTDDLGALEQVEVDRHVAGCAACRAMVAEIESDMAKYAERASTHAEDLARALRREKAKGGEAGTDFGVLFKTRLGPALGIAMAAAAIVILIVKPFDPPARDDQAADTSFKGALALEVFAKRGLARFEVEDGAKLTEGDALRFVVTTAAPGYLTIFAVDGAGEVSCFYPNTDEALDAAPRRLDRAGRHELEGSVVLDGSLGFERIVAVFSRTAFDREEMHARLAGIAKNGEAIPETDGSSIESLSIIKVSRVE